MKTYTLQQIYNLFGGRPEKEIVVTKNADKFKLISMVDYWDTLDDDGTESGRCNDAQGNNYDVVPDPDGKYQPFKIWRKS